MDIVTDSSSFDDPLISRTPASGYVRLASSGTPILIRCHQYGRSTYVSVRGKVGIMVYYSRPHLCILCMLSLAKLLSET